MHYKLSYFDILGKKWVELEFEAKSDKAACKECERVLKDKQYESPALSDMEG